MANILHLFEEIISFCSRKFKFILFSIFTVNLLTNPFSQIANSLSNGEDSTASRKIDQAKNSRYDYLPPELIFKPYFDDEKLSEGYSPYKVYNADNDYDTHKFGRTDNPIVDKNVRVRRSNLKNINFGVQNFTLDNF
ncbi:hypothetical protein EDEG_00634 [Edhazardia aedis USNM 41457]|uniref:Uncharacterized protein n=1 Tax=Edhazardia aedis (strain USNM 41457) TaxID=1003232 RepID=J9DC62_EDHAE|nr:hypothetical protein EDEG_00634 [Edhazardia aedis USNM 41457]|eukprot:EJW05331.1 hypothetical protein EDEG_00634 [Edhazardia aedis USNM 41457]